MSDIPLPAAAVPVWEAYQAMAATKQRHIDYLKQLEDKYQKYGQPSAEENATLAEYLQSHDTQVTAFTSTLNRLKIEDPPAYGALVRRLSADP